MVYNILVAFLGNLGGILEQLNLNLNIDFESNVCNDSRLTMQSFCVTLVQALACVKPSVIQQIYYRLVFKYQKYKS
jgi:hypothetical protein